MIGSKKTVLVMVNVAVLVFLLLVGSVAWCELSPGENSPRTLIIPDDSLVLQGKLSGFSVTGENNEVTVRSEAYLSIYPLKTETEVLSGAAIDFTVPTIGYTGRLSETTPGKYSVNLTETLIVTPDHTLSEANTWQIKPLEYTFTLNGRENKGTPAILPVPVAALSKNLNTAADLALSLPPLVDYIADANISSCIENSRQYRNTFSLSLKARLLDSTGNPVAGKQLSATFRLPGHNNYTETITLTTDQNGIISYARTESALINITGGSVTTLTEPLAIEGASFMAAQFWWTEPPKEEEPPAPSDPEQVNNGPTADPNATVASDPINVTTGNVFSVFEDLIIPGKGIPLQFTRTYNSKFENQGPFGFGWTHS
ncbi:MAG: hypothetical protein VR68_05635 [Peptococcaceae bacterium BRH_c4a]|nr:MAG: hypothetical protein VR68_05635 [Peptococcaceae bacterium BRH_c4a]